MSWHSSAKKRVIFFERMSKENIKANLMDIPLLMDYFGPSNPENYPGFKNLKIYRDQVLWIDS